MTRRTLFAGCLLGLSLIGLAGCVDSNNRVPTQTEVKQADVKRQSYIDTIPNLTPQQRAQMKAHMGGPPAPNPAGKPGAPSAAPAEAKTSS